MPTAASALSSGHVAFVSRLERTHFIPPSAAHGSISLSKVPPSINNVLLCKASLAADAYPSSSLEAVMSKETEATRNIGSRIRVKAPIKVYHVTKVPELNLYGMEGVIKQYVCSYKGKRVSANLPFKIEFLLPAEGDKKTIKFFTHLREEEFEIL